MRIRDRWVRKEPLGVNWQRKQNHSMVGKKDTYHETKTNPLGNRTSSWETKVGIRKAVKTEALAHERR